MAIKKKTDLDALASLSAEDRADITALFDGIDERNTQIADMRKKAGDADEVARKNKDLEKLLSEKENLSKELQTKLAALTTNAPIKTESFDDLGPFAGLRADLESFFGDDEPDPE